MATSSLKKNYDSAPQTSYSSMLNNSVVEVAKDLGLLAEEATRKSQAETPRASVHVINPKEEYRFWENSYVQADKARNFDEGMPSYDEAQEVLRRAYERFHKG